MYIILFGPSFPGQLGHIFFTEHYILEDLFENKVEKGIGPVSLILHLIQIIIEELDNFSSLTQVFERHFKLYILINYKPIA